MWGSYYRATRNDVYPKTWKTNGIKKYFPWRKTDSQRVLLVTPGVHRRQQLPNEVWCQHWSIAKKVFMLQTAEPIDQSHWSSLCIRGWGLGVWGWGGGGRKVEIMCKPWVYELSRKWTLAKQEDKGLGGYDCIISCKEIDTSNVSCSVTVGK